MNQYHLRAIELKYKRFTYKEISKELGGKLSIDTLNSYFKVDGKLYIPYLQYEAEQRKLAGIEAREEFKADLGYAAKIMRRALQEAIKLKDWKLVLEIIKEQMDRAGFVVVRQSKIEDNRRPQLTYDEYLAECKRTGINPKTGLRDDGGEVESDQ